MAKRRQGDHEPFDVYKVSLKSLVGRLIKTISEQKLVKLLVENTKPTLRHELMHLELRSVAQLVDKVRHLEQFYSDHRNSDAIFQSFNLAKKWKSFPKLMRFTTRSFVGIAIRKNKNFLIRMWC